MKRRTETSPVEYGLLDRLHELSTNGRGLFHSWFGVGMSHRYGILSAAWSFVSEHQGCALSGHAAERKRLLRVLPGNLKNNHLNIAGHHDFFPSNCFGASRRADSRAQPISVFLDGLDIRFETDIPRAVNSIKPRNFLRERSLIGKFYRKHKIKTGDVLALERLGDREYRLYPFHAHAVRAYDWHDLLESEPPGEGPTVLDLFSGCGGMALGFKGAGFRTKLAVEWDRSACQTFRANISDRIAQCAIEEIERFPSADVVVGGPPCQGFSNLGERVPFDPRRQLWRQYLRAVEEAQPMAFVMENVPPLLQSQEYFEIKRHAERLGFNVEGWVLNAADYGVPQTRKRAIIIGLRGELPTLPEPTHCAPAKRREPGSFSALPTWVTVREAMGDLPFVPTETDWHLGRKPTAMSLQRYKSIPSGGNRFNLPTDITPACWIRKKSGGTDLFGRLWWDRPSVTIRTEFFKPEKGRYLHPEAHRPITHREAMRLQGFPDDFTFVGSKIEVARQVGNAVPPPLAAAISRYILERLVTTKASRRRLAHR